MLKTVYRSSCRDKHNCQRCHSNLGPLTPQSDALTTRLLRLANISQQYNVNNRLCNNQLQNDAGPCAGILPYFWCYIKQKRASTLMLQLHANSFGSRVRPSPSSQYFRCPSCCKPPNSSLLHCLCHGLVATE